MSCFLLQCYGSLDQLKNQCRDAGDCDHRPHNYNGACAPVSARKSLCTRSCRLFTICKPSDDLSFHLVHRCNQMRAYASMAERERHVFAGDVPVTTFHTHS
jgi:hypothetical protein